MAHCFEGFLQHLRNTVFDIAGKILGHVVVEVSDADGLGHVPDVVWVPHRHGDSRVTAVMARSGLPGDRDE